MKFKTNAVSGYDYVKIKDTSGDRLRIEKAACGDGVFVAVNEGIPVHVSAKKLKKLLKLLNEV